MACSLPWDRYYISGIQDGNDKYMKASGYANLQYVIPIVDQPRIMQTVG